MLIVHIESRIEKKNKANNLQIRFTKRGNYKTSGVNPNLLGRANLVPESVN